MLHSNIAVNRDAISPDQLDDLLLRLQGDPNPSGTLTKLRTEYPKVYGPVYERILRQTAPNDANAYHEYCFRNDDGSTIRPQPRFHREWNDIWDLNPQRFFVMAPRDHSKTTQTIQRTLWELGRNPNLRIKIVSNADDKAQDILGAIKDHIENNPFYHELFPHIVPDTGNKWTGHKLFVERPGVGIKDASVEAVGVLGSATGGRADLIIFDDIVDYRNAIQNPALRDVVRGAFFDVWLNLLEPDGRAWILGTQWHEDDLYKDLKSLCEQERSGWILWKKPCVIKKIEVVGRLDADGNPTGETVRKVTREPLWKERWALDVLESRRLETGEKAFARQWMLRTVSEDETEFNEPVWHSDKTFADVPKDWPRFMGVDLASSFKKRGAFTVFFTAALEPGTGIRHPVDIVRGRYTFDQIVKILCHLYDLHKHYHIKVETNAFQVALFQHVSKMFPSMPISSIVTGKNKSDPDIGIPSLTLEYERELWHVYRPRPELGEESVWATWLDELTAYPVGTNTDTVMANWFVKEAIRELESTSRPRIRLLHDDYTEDRLEQRLAAVRAVTPKAAETTTPEDTQRVASIITAINDARTRPDAAEVAVLQQVAAFAEFMIRAHTYVDLALAESVTNAPRGTIIGYLKKLGYTESGAGKYVRSKAS